MKKVLSVLCMALLAGGMIFTSCTKNFTITVESNPANAGTVTGGGTFADQATTVLTATPNAGYQFVKWQDGNTQNPRTITVTANETYTAFFEAIPQNEAKWSFRGNNWTAANMAGVNQSSYLAFFMFKTAGSQEDVHVLGFFQPTTGTFDYQSSQGDYMVLRDQRSACSIVSTPLIFARTISSTWKNDLTDVETVDQTGNNGTAYTLSGVMTNASWEWATSKDLNVKKANRFQKVK